MRRQKLFRASSAQSLCAFCACRFPIEAHFSLGARRQIHTTRRPHQSAAASAAAPEEQDRAQPSSFRPQNLAQNESSPGLTPAEQAEKLRRQQEYARASKQREEQQQKFREQRDIAYPERRGGPAKGADAEHGPKDTPPQRAPAKIRGRTARSAQYLQQQRSSEAGSVYRPMRMNFEQKQREPQQNRATTPVPGLGAKAGEGQSKKSPQKARTVMPSFGSGPGAQQHQAPRQARTTMPPFGSGAGSAKERNGSMESGWGAGVTSTRPIQAAPFTPTKPANNEGEVGWGVGTTTTKPDQRSEGERPGDRRQGMAAKLYGAPTSEIRMDAPSNDTTYRATPIDAREYGQAFQHKEDMASDWQHIRRVGKQPSSPPVPPAPASSNPSRQEHPASQNHFLDDPATIEREFQEHQRKRSTPHQISWRNESQTGAPASRNVPGVGNRRQGSAYLDSAKTAQCQRCLEYGHRAYECTGPMRSTCKICGEVGHWGPDCPRRLSKNDRKRRSISAEQATGPFEMRGNGRVQQKDAGAGLDSIVVQRPQRTVFGRADQQETSGRVEKRDASTDKMPEPPAFDATNAISEEPEPEEQAESRSARRASRGWAGEEEPDVYGDRKGKKGRRNKMVNEKEDEGPDEEVAAQRRERAARKAAKQADKKADKEAKKREVNLPEFVSVSNLAQTLGLRYESFVNRLTRLGYDDIFPGMVLNSETSGLIAMEYNFEPVFDATSGTAQKEEQERDLKARPEAEDKEFLPIRPPVVTIMGHVDHGKTTILDYLRKSSVAAGEAGGITQHIGAFSVPLSSSGKTITFLDTPGHAAFLSMRQRGANVTDLVILVVAADDSVKPQTLESIRCAKEANVPMIVAINKIDKDSADTERVKHDLARHGVEIEDFGGDTQVVAVSGKTGEGLEELEEAAVTLSEILDHRAETDGMVEGRVLEATTKRAGRVATVLVKRGTLRPGSVIVAGQTWARVRTLRDERDKSLREVGPGMPVEVDGWRDQPIAGDEVLQAPNEQKAHEVVDYRLEKAEREKTAQDMEAINEFRRLEQEKRAQEKADAANAKAAAEATNEDNAQSKSRSQPDPTAPPTHQAIPFIIKADVSGSAEAVSAYIPSIASSLISPNILSSAVGPVHESDIELAAASGAHIIAFNLPKNEELHGQALARGVKVLENNIIYRVLDDVKAVLEDRLPPLVTQRVLGEAEIGEVFEIGVGGKKKLRIAGCKVRNGVVNKGGKAWVWRAGSKVFEGTIDSLKNVKKDVQEMRKGTECGMSFEGWQDFETGDQVQLFEEVREKRKL